MNSGTSVQVYKQTSILTGLMFKVVASLVKPLSIMFLCIRVKILCKIKSQVDRYGSVFKVARTRDVVPNWLLVN